MSVTQENASTPATTAMKSFAKFFIVFFDFFVVFKCVILLKKSFLVFCFQFSHPGQGAAILGALGALEALGVISVLSLSSQLSTLNSKKVFRFPLSVFRSQSYIISRPLVNLERLV